MQANQQKPLSTNERLERMEMVIHEMDAQLQHVQALVIVNNAKANEHRAEETDSKQPMRDEVWACQNCGARLGIYNKEKEELRVRYKDFVAYVIPGVGGTIMVPCRRCGEQNTLEDSRTKE